MVRAHRGIQCPLGWFSLGKSKGKGDNSPLCNCLVKGYKEEDRLFSEVYDDRTKKFSTDTT